MSAPTKQQFLEKFNAEQLAGLLVEGYETAKQATVVAEQHRNEAEKLSAQLNTLNADFKVIIATLRKIKNVFPFGENGGFEMQKLMQIVQQVQGNNELITSFGEAMKIVEKYENNTVHIKK